MVAWYAGSTHPRSSKRRLLWAVLFASLHRIACDVLCAIGLASADLAACGGGAPDMTPPVMRLAHNGCDCVAVVCGWLHVRRVATLWPRLVVRLKSGGRHDGTIPMWGVVQEMHCADVRMNSIDTHLFVWACAVGCSQGGCIACRGLAFACFAVVRSASILELAAGLALRPAVFWR